MRLGTKIDMSCRKLDLICPRSTFQRNSSAGAGRGKMMLPVGGEVTNQDLVELLRERPEFVELCKDESWKSGMWKALDERDWTWLLEAQPQLEKFKPAK